MECNHDGDALFFILPTRHFVLGAHELMDIYGILSLVCI